MNNDIAISIEHVSKEYRLGAIGGRTLNAELQSWWARKRGKEDPNLKIGQSYADYGKKFLALDDINIEIKKGEAVGIIGSNGAGKSTLLKILSRVTTPTGGDVWLNGRVASMLEVGTGFHPELTGRENIYMNGAILGMTRKEIDSKIEDIIDFSECREFIDTPVKRYSSGMYVKLAFAVISHLDAEIMIMDEVLAVGDMKFQKKCLGKMGDASQNEGKTVLYVSHNMATIRNLCTRCIVLDCGKVIFDGEVEEAINVYMENNESNLNNSYNLSKEKRVKQEFGQDVHIDSLTFFGEHFATCIDDENLYFKLDYSAKHSFTDIKFFIHIFNYQSNQPVSITTSQSVCSSVGINTIKICMDFSTLASGLYYFEIGAMRFLPNNQHITLDRIKKNINFEIIKTDETNLPIWNHSIYGSIRIPEMRIVNEIEEKK